jgi:hypothetical protein
MWLTFSKRRAWTHDPRASDPSVRPGAIGRTLTPCAVRTSNSMKAQDLKNDTDRKAAERSERRHRARTYKDRPIQRKEKPEKDSTDER